MSEKDWQIRINDILASLAKIARYTEGMSQEEFVNNDLVIDAVSRNLEIIGEAAKKTPDEIKKANPLIPWDDDVAYAPHLIHEYGGVNLDIVWQTIQEDLPPLNNALEALLSDSE